MYAYLSIYIEIFLALQLLFILIVSALLNEKTLRFKYKFNIIRWLNFFSCYILFYGIFILWGGIFFEALLLNYQFIVDSLSFFLKIITIFMTFIILLISIHYNILEKIKAYEYLILMLLSIIGLFVLLSCTDLITMYLAIELQSLCFYIMTSIKFNNNNSIEAGLKYFVLGAVSSCILLFGCSIIYGFSGIINFKELTIFFYNSNTYLNEITSYYYDILLWGVIFIYCGILFKIGIVPFHMWLADIYEGAPANIAIFFAVVPQFSVIGILIRLNLIFFETYYQYFHYLFMFLSAITVTVGTLGAIYQTKLKRIFAFSSVSNMGYLISLMCGFNIEIVNAMLFYIVIYNLISLGLWSLLLSFRNRSTNTTFVDISELFLLFNSDKALSIFWSIFLFSAMGVPPLLGFFSKLYLFMMVINLNMYIFLFYLIFLNGLSVFYFLRLIKLMYSYKSDKDIFLEDIGEFKSIMLILLIYMNIFFFIYPLHIIIFIQNVLLKLFFFW